jgi:hypothetical protein
MIVLHRDLLHLDVKVASILPKNLMDQLKALMSSESSEFEFRGIDFKHTVKALFRGKWSSTSAFAFVSQSAAMTELMKALRFKKGCLLRFGHATDTPGESQLQTGLRG